MIHIKTVIIVQHLNNILQLNRYIRLRIMNTIRNKIVINDSLINWTF